MKKNNFSQKFQSSKTPPARADHLFLVRGLDDAGKQSWYYILVDKGKRDAFRAREGRPSLNLTEYGIVLHSGFGQNPPAALARQMELDYGFKE